MGEAKERYYLFYDSNNYDEPGLVLKSFDRLDRLTAYLLKRLPTVDEFTGANARVVRGISLDVTPRTGAKIDSYWIGDRKEERR